MGESQNNASLIFGSKNTECVFDLGYKDFGCDNASYCFVGNSNGERDSDADSDMPPENVLQVHAGLSSTLGTTVYDVRNFGDIPSVLTNVIEMGMENGSFLVCNLAPIVKQLAQWREQLPMVDPFYAVKCHPDPVIVKMLASMGCGFDCATMSEIDMVVNQLGDVHSFSKSGRASSDIVYANPAKMEHMLEFAKNSQVCMTVFDGEDELYKIARVARSNGNHHDFQLLVRIATDDKDSVCKFSNKYGCPYKESHNLLVIAKSLGLHVAGVSFHVGSGCGDAAAYTTALRQAAEIFRWAEELGMPPMHIVDIGGGFPGDNGGYGGPGLPTFLEIASVVRESITDFCTILSRPMDSFRFIAEPGRYFVSASTTIATKIHSRKGGMDAYQALYVDDGVYGSFNTVVYDHATPIPKKLPLSSHADPTVRPQSECSLSSANTATSTNTSTSTSSDGLSRCNSNLSLLNVEESSVVPAAPEPELIPTAVFGPTCDGLDQMCALEGTMLERCEVGDWLYFENQGAYTHTASFVFNGFTHIPNKIHCFLI